METLAIFYTLAALVILCSLMVITLRNAVTSAVFLIADLFLLAALYAQMGADFIAGIQVLVYAGAIVVLFLFVIMLLNYTPGHREEQGEGGHLERAFGAGLLALVAGLSVVLACSSKFSLVLPHAFPFADSGDNTYQLGVALFEKYLWPFELSSLLILLAIVASIFIAKKKPPYEGKRQ